MAVQDTMNLIDEISGNQKNNDYIILTSFCFDPYFFDNFLLQKIRSNNPFAEIIVLIDGGQYVKSQERFTDQTGRIYQLIPIYVNNGVFHPKLFLFVSRQKRKTTAFVGSSNITLSGFSKNAELIMKVEYTEESFDSNSNAIKNFFEKLIEFNFIQDQKAIAIIQAAMDHIRSSDKINSDFSFLHNLEFSLISQLLDIIPNSSFQELFLFAPFYSPYPDLFVPLVKKFNINKVKIGIQENNHNITDPRTFVSLFDKLNLVHEFNQITYIDDTSRIFHSKIMHFQGDTNYLLIGSPNMTKSALDLNAGLGNTECAVIFNSSIIPDLIQKISYQPISDLQKVKAFIDSNEDTPPIHQLKIFSVSYDDIRKTLSLTTEIVVGPCSAIIRYDDKTKIQEYPVNLSNGKFSIPSLPDGTPYEIEIISENTSGKRRIYHDRGFFFRNISRSTSSLQEISNRLSLDSHLNDAEIELLLMGIWKRNHDKYNDSAKDSLKTKQDKRENSGNYLKPSKLPSANSLQSTIRALDQLNYTLKINAQRERVHDNLDFDEIDEEDSEVIRENEMKNVNYQDVEKNTDRLIYKIHGLFLHDLYLQDNINLKNGLVLAESSFLNIILRKCIRLLKQQHIDLIEDILTENLERVDQRDVTPEATLILFENILTLNYHHDLHYHPEIFGKTISYQCLLIPENYYRIKKFLEEFSKQYILEDFKLDLKKFHTQFASLIQFCFNSSTISDAPINILNAMQITDNRELLTFYSEVLHRMKSGPWNYKRSIFTIEYPRKKLTSFLADKEIKNVLVREYVDAFLKS